MNIGFLCDSEQLCVQSIYFAPRWQKTSQSRCTSFFNFPFSACPKLEWASLLTLSVQVLVVVVVQIQVFKELNAKFVSCFILFPFVLFLQNDNFSSRLKFVDFQSNCCEKKSLLGALDLKFSIFLVKLKLNSLIFFVQSNPDGQEIPENAISLDMPRHSKSSFFSPNVSVYFQGVNRQLHLRQIVFLILANVVLYMVIGTLIGQTCYQYGSISMCQLILPKATDSNCHINVSVDGDVFRWFLGGIISNSVP